MQPSNAKQEAISAIQNLPDNTNLDEILYRLYVIKKVQQGLKQLDEGQVISQEELQREIEQW